MLDTHMPLITTRPRHPPCPWLDDELRTLMRERDLACEEYRADPVPETRDRYRACRNRVKSAQSHARADLFLTSFRYSRKTTWKDLRRFMVAPRGASAAPPL